jgi:hypothetical protein
VVPHLWRSTPALWTQPFRAGLIFGAGPLGLGLQTPLSQFIGFMTSPKARSSARDDKGKVRFSGKVVADDKAFSNLVWTGLIFNRPFGTGPIRLHGWSLFSKCCPNQTIEKTNSDKSDLP